MKKIFKRLFSILFLVLCILGTCWDYIECAMRPDINTMPTKTFYAKDKSCSIEAASDYELGYRCDSIYVMDLKRISRNPVISIERLHSYGFDAHFIAYDHVRVLSYNHKVLSISPYDKDSYLVVYKVQSIEGTSEYAPYKTDMCYLLIRVKNKMKYYCTIKCNKRDFEINKNVIIAMLKSFKVY